ncbi:MAG: phenylalanine--tRNA ligase subunit beta [Sphingomonadales bacterium]
MKFTLGWLKDHLDTKATLDEIVEKLTAIGLEVEKVENPGEKFAAFVVGEVKSAEKHPNADKLSVCIVNDGKKDTQVVCGAPNAKAGMKGVFAPSGTHVPGTGLDLKPTEIRGVKSNGMLCSERELELSDEHDGIIELPADAPVGKSYAEYAGLNDPMIEIAITPNRQDCLGVAGIARDLAAAGLGKVITPEPKPLKGSFKSPQALTLNFDKGDERACPVFVGRYFKGIKNGESPAWLQQRLRAIGLRPISALVDITNYVSYDRTRPLHVYDAGKIEGTLCARLGKKGEGFLALDEKTYQLEGGECVIADDKNVLGFGGVMGGEASGCTSKTTEVFLEVALFDPILTAMTGRKHGIDSDARYRFERGVDAKFVIPGAELATALILEFCGGEASDLVIAGAVPKWTHEVTFRSNRVKTLGGLDIPAKKSFEILKNLGFEVGAEKAGTCSVKVPSWRVDVEGEADLVEEVCRIYGYDNIPLAYLETGDVVPKPTLSGDQRRLTAVKRALAATGFAECVTYSFLQNRVAKLFGGAQDSVILENPISSEMDCMRPSILPGLIQAGVRNAARGANSIALFEVGAQYNGDAPEDQAGVAAGILIGAKTPRHWKRRSENPGVMDAKAAAFKVLEAAGFSPHAFQIEAGGPDWYHPSRTGTLKLGPKNTVGVFGEIHPGIAKKMGAKGPVAAFEIYLDALPKPKEGKAKTKSTLVITDLQTVERDFAFVVSSDTPAGDLTRAVMGADKKHIKRVTIFDVFEGKDLAVGTKSVAISVHLEPSAKTFTEAEIEAISAAIIGAVENKVDGKLRT